MPAGRPKKNDIDETEQKTCSKCNQGKDLAEFHKTRRVCKDCIKAKNQGYYSVNKDSGKWGKKD